MVYVIGAMCVSLCNVCICLCVLYDCLCHGLRCLKLLEMGNCDFTLVLFAFVISSRGPCLVCGGLRCRCAWPLGGGRGRVKFTCGADEFCPFPPALPIISDRGDAGWFRVLNIVEANSIFQHPRRDTHGNRERRRVWECKCSLF